jgi:hypothetical protein
MPTSFLDLPREIRDIIYEHALVSPTGYVTPVDNKSSRPLRWSLHAVNVVGDFVVNGSSTNHKEEFIIEDAVLKVDKNGTVSLSLSRTCRQIREETSHIALSNNIVAFKNVPSMTRVLKSMGQAPSRLITSVQLPLTCRYYRTLSKAFALLKSRARHGCFQKLYLVIPRDDFRYLIHSKRYTQTSYDDVWRF